MANIFQQKTRHALPAFRTFADTAAAGELRSVSVSTLAKQQFDTAARLRDWSSSRTLACAGDLLSGQVVSGIENLPMLEDAARFVLDQGAHAPGPLARLAARLLSGDVSGAGTSQLPRLADFVEANSRRAIHQKIASNRQRAVRWPRNPVVYVENARLYSILGRRDRAMQNMHAALALAPTNRFVLRSATRLYAHYREEERALHLLSRNPRTPKDPWLASAELALAGMLGLDSRYVKRGLSMATSADFSPASLSELSSGVGSVLLANGDRRKSRRLFEAALVEPNDNALAQVEWAFSLDRLFAFEVAAFNVERNYEALAREAFGRGDWTGVLRYCEAWFLDMPFARGPVAMGAHVASIVLDDYEAAALFCRAGLVSHPHDQQLENNLAYALALAGRADEAAEILDEVVEGRDTSEATAISLLATRGLVAFRRGLCDQGRALYREAIEAAARTTVPGLAQLAVLNYAREELLAGSRLEPALVSELRSFTIDHRHVTLSIFKNKVVAMLDAKDVSSELGR